MNKGTHHILQVEGDLCGLDVSPVRGKKSNQGKEFN